MSTLNKQERKEARRKAQIPQPRTYNVQLPNGSYQKVKATFGIDKVAFTTEFPYKGGGKAGAARKVVCTFTFGTAPVERKVKMYGKVLRGHKGGPLLVSVDLPATTATISVNGEKFPAARSYCKPPDVWNRATGIKFALRHLLHTPEVVAALQPEDFESLVRICLTKPPKPGHIKKVEEKLAARKQQIPATQ